MKKLCLMHGINLLRQTSTRLMMKRTVVRIVVVLETHTATGMIVLLHLIQLIRIVSLLLVITTIMTLIQNLHIRMILFFKTRIIFKQQIVRYIPRTIVLLHRSIIHYLRVNWLQLVFAFFFKLLLVTWSLKPPFV